MACTLSSFCAWQANCCGTRSLTSCLPLQVLDPEFQRAWIRTHATHAKDVLRKPVCSQLDYDTCASFCALSCLATNSRLKIHVNPLASSKIVRKLTPVILSTWCLQLLFEEFGKWLNASANATMADRNATFATVFDEAEQIMDQPGSSLKGLGEQPYLSWRLSNGKLASAS